MERQGLLLKYQVSNDHNLHFDVSLVACESHYSSSCSNVSLTTAFLHCLPDCGYSKLWCVPSLITILQEPRLCVCHFPANRSVFSDTVAYTCKFWSAAGTIENHCKS